jgi:5'-deoxynucleotidase YfbR-like HD superfamily hydrolase
LEGSVSGVVGETSVGRGKQADLLWSAGQVTRYHTLITLRRQSVAEHVYGVLTYLNVLMDFQVPPGLAKAALLHDVAEVLTGDLPAPAKRALKSNGGGLALIKMEEDLEAAYGLTPHVLLSLHETRMLKLADCLEGMRFCAQEVALGNRAMGVVMRRFGEYIEELGPLDGRERELVDAVRSRAGIIEERSAP